MSDLAPHWMDLYWRRKADRTIAMTVQALSNNTFRYVQSFKWFKEALDRDRGADDDSDVELEWPSDGDTIYDG